jgi:zinc/manganese transport system substrate-binding protein
MAAMAAKLPVVASFSIVADMTREIGGERVDVVSLVGRIRMPMCSTLSG